MDQPIQPSDAFLGVGIYSIREVARLTGVPARTVGRWIGGYNYKHQGEIQTSSAVISHQLPTLDGTVALGFRDLIEVRVVHAMRTAGVTWKTIRLAREHAAKLLRTTTPFASARFKTDGRGVFSFIGGTARNRILIDLSASQYAFRTFVGPYLVDVEFDDKADASRWWPLGARRSVLLDPQRSFGQPIVPQGVPTAILAAAVRAGGSIETVAKWYELPVRSVRDAVDFEEGLQARPAA
jgi:uncharacterized protein (DUF433 family)